MNAQTLGDPRQPLGDIADDLKRNRAHLIDALFKGNIADFPARNAALIDQYFQNSFERSMIGPGINLANNPYAFIALGGYGREEQCIHSDIDLLFLFKKRVPDAAEDLIREMLYPLWDIGMDVGHATRSIDECIELASVDYEVLTSILDARFICGMSPLFSEMRDRLRKKIIFPRSRKIIHWLVETNRERHQRFGDSSYLLEPNLKEGQGGLRDYHTLLWVARVLSNLSYPRELEIFGYLSHAEYECLKTALDFIWHVRSHLHHLCGRKNDQLYFEYQMRVAEKLGYRPADGQQAVEVFLGRLHGEMSFIKELHLIQLAELGFSPRRKLHKRVSWKKTGNKELTVNRNLLNFVSSERIVGRPELLIEIFEESVRLGIPLCAEAKRVVREFAFLMDAERISMPHVVRGLEKILVTPSPTFNVLSEMLNTGLLVQLIPEFGKIVNRIQYDEYHLFPVDRHSLRAVQILKSFGTEEDPTRLPLCGNIYRELGAAKKTVVWATLLHDIGKGDEGDDHSGRGARMISAILSRFEYPPRMIETVAFLVAEHLFLVKTATRRDINDEETAIFCARRIRDVRRLKMLYLLSVADCVATGPNAWSEWTEMLLQDLFIKVLNILEKGELASGKAVEAVENKKRNVLRTAKTQAEREIAEQLLAAMSPRYLLYTPDSEMIEHIRLYNSLGDKAFAWKIIPDEKSNTRTVIICAKDHPGLFATIAGVFTLNNMNILNARIFTWRNRIALDIFKVTPPPDTIFEGEKWDRTESDLRRAIAGELALASALEQKMEDYRTDRSVLRKRPPRLVIDNESSRFFTLIEIFADDYPGLLYKITSVLFECRLDVWVAKIATQADQVVDVFYVRDLDGQKVDAPEQVEHIRAAIEPLLENEDSLPAA